MSDPVKTITYAPQVFETAGFDAAKAIILTPERGTTTEERWRVETPFLAEYINGYLAIDAGSILLDYGCGIGRLSKAMIDLTGCSCVGVDISPRMREMAPDYVNSPRFKVVSPEELRTLAAGGFTVDAAIASWVLQHCAKPAEDIAAICGVLGSSDWMFVLNNDGRAVPTDAGWIEDGINLDALLSTEFEMMDRERFPAGASSAFIAANSFLTWWRRR